MKRFLYRFSSVIVVCAAMSASLNPAAAQDARPAVEDTPRQPGQQPQQTRTQQTDRNVAGNIDSATSGSLFRASQLIGMSIQNPAGKDVGDINDLVMDANTGKIRYAAVTYGGFLGIGNKMFAVPFEAFKFERDQDDADRSVLILNINEQKLEGAVGFDEENWPDFADNKFTEELDKRYGVDRQRMRERSGRVDVDINRNGVDVDVDRDNK